MTNTQIIANNISDEGFANYMQQIKAFPVLTAEEELELANKLQETGDTDAAHKLVTSHLRLVAKIAWGQRGYGLPLMDLIAEGSIGLMQAVKKFEPKRGFRLSTYAMWWIKASMQEYILKSWSTVKVGTSASKKKLFFNLKRLKNRLLSNTIYENLSQTEVSEIAKELDVSESEVIDMDALMSSHDQSLNTKVGEEDGSVELIDLVEDKNESQELVLADGQEQDARKQAFAKAMLSLNERERDIILQRKVEEPPVTLEDLSQKYSISRERVRQIENKSFEKLQAAVLSLEAK